MAKGKKGGGGKKFVRDAVGRFARAGGEALGRVAKQAMKSAEDDLTKLGQQAAKDAVAAADARYQRANANWNEEKGGVPGTDMYHETKEEYARAIRARAKARAKLAEMN